ncbi:MAG: SDR family NAD(P)-dependent oxidoreductase [Flavobacteriales bacterium]
MKKSKVLVTGVAGYIGQHCALELLKKGFNVIGSLRNISKAHEVETAIKQHIEIKDNLEFCQLDLLIDNGWEEAMNGCDFVLHVASPYVSYQPKDENELIKPAVEGTSRVLKFAKKFGVKRVVVTSSVVAMLGDANASIDINSKSWTNINAKNVSAYVKSKTMAEKLAWDFVTNQHTNPPLELVVINPGPVFGPTLTGNLNGASMSMYKDLISGKMPMLPQSSINMSDVRDVAEIHVKALENKQAVGKRFIVTTEKPYSFQEMAKILKLEGYNKVSTAVAPNFFLRFMSNFSNDIKGMLPFIGFIYNADVSETIKVFNWKPIDLKKTVLDTAKSIDYVQQ